MTHRVGGPGHGHQPHRASEIRHVKTYRRRAVRPDFDDARVERHQHRSCRRGAEPRGRTVAADAQRAGHALGRVDQLAIEIAHFHAEFALAEEPAIGIGGLELGQVENAEIDCGHGDIGLLARLGIGELDAGGEGLARQRHRRRVEHHVKLHVARIDIGEGEPEGTRRHALFSGAGRPVEDRGHIGARTPVLSHLQGNGRAFGGHVDRLHVDNPVVDHQHQSGAGELRIKAKCGGVAGAIGRLVECHLQGVGGVRAGLRIIVASVEFVARGSRVVPAALDLQPVAAIVDSGRNGDRAGGGRVGGAVGDFAGGGDGFPLPGATVAVPLIVGLDARQGPIEPGLVDGLASRGDDDDVEAGLAALGKTIGVAELRLQPDAIDIGEHRPGQAALDGAAIGIDQPHDDLCFERPGGRLRRRYGDFGGGIAIRIGGADDAQRLTIGLDIVVEPAEGVAGILGQRGDRRDHRVGLDGEVGRGGAVKILCRDADRGDFVDLDRLVCGADLEGEPLGLEILDEEGRAGQRLGLGIGIEPDGPGAAHGIGIERQGVEIATGAAVIDHGARGDHTVGAFQLQCQRQVGHGLGVHIAQQRGEEHRFARAIDATFRCGEQIERARRGPAGNAAVGQIKGGLRHIEKGVVAGIGFGDQQLRGATALATGKTGREIGAAGGIRYRFAEDFVVDRHQPHFRAGHRLGTA